MIIECEYDPECDQGKIFCDYRHVLAINPETNYMRIPDFYDDELLDGINKFAKEYDLCFKIIRDKIGLALEYMTTESKIKRIPLVPEVTIQFKSLPLYI